MYHDRRYFVYILASYSGTLYVGVTGDLRHRVWQHKQHLLKGFTEQYDVTRLLYFEMYDRVNRAIGREKQLKGWRREKKIALIQKCNPQWKDLSKDWYASLHP